LINFFDHFTCAVHPLGDKPFKAILELCGYLKQNIREDRYPACWSDFPNNLFEECVFERTENELLKYVETLNFCAEKIAKEAEKEAETARTDVRAAGITERKGGYSIGAMSGLDALTVAQIP
jgi:hypothetical protein